MSSPRCGDCLGERYVPNGDGSTPSGKKVEFDFGVGLRLMKLKVLRRIIRTIESLLPRNISTTYGGINVSLQSTFCIVSNLIKSRILFDFHPV
jgi:hypothetical protein